MKSRPHDDAMAELMAGPEVRAQSVKPGVEPVGSTAEELSQLMPGDLQLWTAVARKANIQPE